jgi:hypothetical protein
MRESGRGRTVDGKREFFGYGERANDAAPPRSEVLAPAFGCGSGLLRYPHFGEKKKM